MADNVTLTGVTVAADEIAGVAYQRMKLGLGADGSAADAEGGAGAVGTGVQRMTLASDDPAVTSLAVIDDWDESDRAKVNPIAGQAGVAAGAGAVDALTQRATLASDDPAVTSLAVIDDWDETNRCAVNLISGQVGVAAGAGAVDALTQRGTLASDDPAVTSLAVIDDWDESDRAKVNPIAGQAGVAAGAGAVDALTQRTTLASDDPAVTSLAVIDDWDESNRCAVNLISGQAGIAGGTGVDGATVPRVSLVTDVALPAGENQLGDVGKPGTVVDVTLSLDTSAYADGDLLADAQEVASAFRENAGRATLKSIQLLDEDDQGVALDLLFLDSATSLGTENITADISDANARNILGVVSIAAADYVDLTSNQIVTKTGVDLKLKAAAGTTSLYVAAITRGGTPTHTASGIRLKLGIEWD